MGLMAQKKKDYINRMRNLHNKRTREQNVGSVGNHNA